MRGYLLHGAVAAVEVLAPWLLRHHFIGSSPGSQAGAAALAMAFGAMLGVVACSVDTHIAGSSLVYNSNSHVLAAHLDAPRRRRRDQAEAAVIRRPFYLVGLGATVSCAAVLLPGHLFSLPVIGLLFVATASCGAAARTDAVIKASQHMWNAEFNQPWSLAHDGNDANPGSADGAARRR
jgi:hypothetical protein